VPRILESLAYRELTRYAAHADVLDLLGKGGIDAAVQLQDNLQAECNRAGFDGGPLGVKIVYVGIGGVHPPADEEVAKAYEEVVGAYETKDARIKQAMGEAADIKVRMAGVGWEELYRAVLAEDEARASNAPDQAQKTAEVDRLLRSVVGGGVRAVAALAEKLSLKKVFDEKAAAEQYALQISAFKAAPEIYMQRTYLKALAEALQRIRKFVVVLEDSEKVLYDVDMRPPQTIDVLGAEAASIDAKQQASQ